MDVNNNEPYLKILVTAQYKLNTTLNARDTAMAGDLTSEVLDILSQSDDPLFTATTFPSIPFSTVKSALDRLGSREMITYKTIDKEEAILTEEAQGITADGSHEAKVFEAVRRAVHGLKIGDLPVRGLKCMPKSLERQLRQYLD